jgi:tetratricopeptide (TPR) repeat protein
MIRILVLLVAVAVSGCAPTSVLKPVDTSQRAWLLSGAPLSGQDAQTPQLPDDHIFALTGEMKQFARQAVRGQPNDEARLNALVSALLKPSGLDVQYDGEATYPARGVFSQHKANCLSFTTLFVPLARYLGFSASYYQVEIPAVWNLEQKNTLVLYKHVNAVVSMSPGYKKVIDINMEAYDTSYPQRIISDKLAKAQYYNNRAMAYLGDRKYMDALRYQLKALSLQPRESFLWSNLATLYNRSGHRRAAEMAYRVALHENPDDLVAISNAARLYESMGRTKLAASLRERAERSRSRNPYYQYVLALKALGNSNFNLAQKYARKAIRLYPREHRFYFLLGVIYEHEGDHIEADKSWKKAMHLASQAQVTRYRHKIDVLQSMNS